jgi:hypothetical protein
MVSLLNTWLSLFVKCCITSALYGAEDDILWGSSDIDCLDLRSDLEETVDCKCETGRTSLLFNLNLQFYVDFCVLIRRSFVFDY